MAKITSLVVALAAIAHIASAVPATPSKMVAVNGRKRINPKIAHKSFTSTDSASSASFAAPGKPEDVATKFVAAQLNIPASDFRVSDIVPLSNGGSAVHLRQVINSLDVANGNINVNVDGHGRVISYGEAFFRGARPAAPPTTVAPGQVHSAAATKVSPQSGFEKLAAAVGLSLDGKKVDVQPVVSVQSVGGKPAQKKWTIKTDAAKSDVPVKYAYIQNGDALKLVYNYAVELDHAWYISFLLPSPFWMILTASMGIGTMPTSMPPREPWSTLPTGSPTQCTRAFPWAKRVPTTAASTT
ncbi:hypothetical protein BC828DRAFT_391869 [Blastocladiella britannica]|nr:hypothetical protein BC828DRAFT_391869 [Blastocladiella britannica]